MKINNILRFISAAIMAFAASASVSCSDGFDVPSPHKPQQPSGTNPGMNGDGRFIAVSGGRGAETRAQLQGDILDGGYYHWDGGDQIGLVIAKGDATLVDNLPMAAYEGGVTHTTFTGELTDPQIESLSQYETFDYYSYFPYDAAIDLSAIPFTIPSSPKLTPNKLDLIAGVPMVAEPFIGGRTAVVMASDRDKVLAEEASVHFDYKHLVSYAAIELDLSLLTAGQTITKIVITGDSPISGTFGYNLYTGTVSPGNGTSISVTIDGGLSTGSGNVIYLPMAPGTVESLTFEFHFDGTQPLKKTIPGTKFEKGGIHHLNVSPPAEFTTTTSFTAPATGYYYIEAWGGDGGNGGKMGGTGDFGPIGAGGKGLRQVGLFRFNAGDEVHVQIGSAGGNGVDGGTGNTGGAGGSAGNGQWFGSGRAGGKGGNRGTLSAWSPGGGGGGSGAASGVLLDGTGVGNIIIASGGGGGGGGGGEEGDNTAPNGGDSGVRGATSNGGTNNGAGGQIWSDAETVGINGSGGQDGNTPGFMAVVRGSGGGGGGGGGFNGANGGGGQNGNGGGSGSNAAAGGGGAGGGSAVRSSAVASNPRGYQFPGHDRPHVGNGYVVITFFRP